MSSKPFRGYHVTRRLLSVPPDRWGPTSRSNQEFHVNNDEVKLEKGRADLLKIDWGRVGFSNERMPALRRKIYRQGTEQLVGRSIAPFRGKVVERNIRQIEWAVDNFIVLQDMKFDKKQIRT